MGHDITPEGVGAVLRRLRESRALTQEELAERSGITAKAIGALERGERRRPYPHTVRALAEGLGLTEDERAALVAAVPGRVVAAEPGARSDRDPAWPDAAAAPVATATPLAPPGDLVGRESEIADLRALLAGGHHRLITLTGPGGIGKTSLALDVLGTEADRFPGGAVAVDLSPVRQAVHALPRIAAALGRPDLIDQDPLGELARHLHGAPVLLVLDNLEQVAGIAAILADLVARCRGLVVLATSRAALRIRVEFEFSVSPLTLPASTASDAVMSSPAVRLLLDRAGAAGRELPRTGEDAAALAAIARRLDGIPLALELAAPGLRLLTPRALLAMLGRVDLGGAPQDLPPRHLSMEHVLEWSMDLLEPEEIVLFERLSVFIGGFSLDAMEAVATDVRLAGAVGGGSGVSSWPVLAALLEQSLVMRIDVPGGEPRYRMLEPVRRYAMARLHAAGGAHAAADAHAAYFRTVATAAAAGLEGARLIPTLDRLDADHGNLRAAFLRLVELDRDNDAGELAARLWLYLALRGHAREGLEWLDRVGAGLQDATRCRVLTARLGLLLLTGERVAMARESDRASAACRRVVDPSITCVSLTLLAQAAVFAGRLDAASSVLDEAESQARAAGSAWVLAHARIARAQVALASGHLVLAGAEVADAVDRARELGNPFTLATALNVHATLAEIEGDAGATAALLGESVALSVTGRLSWTLGYALPALAGVALRVGDPKSAAWLFGAAAAVSVADAVDPTFPIARTLADRGLEQARVALDPAAFAREWADGRAADGAAIAGRCATVTARAGAARTG
ncbi:ATP-binding protein [Demequina phytophila]|uniref:ATP-binding protein n=1 Tax=Demequina phytophila TaxID=1638981 RepID=UPI0007833031|nr:helix-turn-helix domain-containing protein [Demequina phytophila]